MNYQFTNSIFKINSLVRRLACHLLLNSYVLYQDLDQQFSLLECWDVNDHKEIALISHNLQK